MNIHCRHFRLSAYLVLPFLQRIAQACANVVNIDGDYSDMTSASLPKHLSSYNITCSRTARHSTYSYINAINENVALSISPGYPLIMPFPQIVHQSNTSDLFTLFPSTPLFITLEKIIPDFQSQSRGNKFYAKIDASSAAFCDTLSTAILNNKRKSSSYFVNKIRAIQLGEATLNKFFVPSDLNKIYKLHQHQKNAFYSISIKPPTNSNSTITLLILFYTSTGYSYALSSLSQILAMSSNDRHILLHLPLTILDWPIQLKRGLLVDVARHYIPVSLLRRTVLGMEALKLNNLHLHLTDSQSFPLLLEDTKLTDTEYRDVLSNYKSYRKSYINITRVIDGVTYYKDILANQTLLLSELSARGAFNSAKIYTKASLRQLVKFASLHHVEIIPEIDMPAHSKSWGNVFKPFIVNCTNVANAAQSPDDIYPLNPSEPLLYLVIRKVLDQLVDIFPSPYLHVGGDEVNLKCWDDSKSLCEWREQKLLNSSKALFRKFESDVFAIVKNLSKIPVVWQGVIDSDALPDSEFVGKATVRNKSTLGSEEEMNESDDFEQNLLGSNITSKAVVQPWKCWGGLALRSAISAARSEHPVIMSACWYLDFNDPWTSYLLSDSLAEAQAVASSEFTTANLYIGRNRGSHISKAKLNEPPTGSFAHPDYFMGGEGSIWTEHVDHSNFECRVWPRTAIIASHLWGLNLSALGLVMEQPLDTVEFNNEMLQKYGNLNDSKSDSNALSDILNEIQNRKRRKLKTSGQIELSINATHHLYATYVHISYYLRRMNISSSAFTFHYPHIMNSNISSSSANNHIQMKNTFLTSRLYHYNTIQPFAINNETDAIRRIYNDACPLTLIPGSKQPPTGHGFLISAQCLGIPQQLQRPLETSRIMLAQLNVAEGSTGTRGKKMLDWLQEQAASGVMAVGFCELNGWEKLRSDKELMKNKPMIAFRAANAGFAYSHIMVNSQPYHIGIVSAVLFDVLGEHGPPLFQRGVLHAYFPSVRLHVLVTHLHAHSSEAREREAALIITNIIQPIQNKDRGARIVIMGDLNTLSSHDRRHHEDVGLLNTLNRRDHPVFLRLSKKFLHRNFTSINYNPLDLLMNNGFCDSCGESCIQRLPTSTRIQIETNNQNQYLWSMHQQDLFSQCMQQFCSYTEPTRYNPEWPEDLQDKLDHPRIRLDYILLSQSLLRSRIGSSEGSQQATKTLSFTSYVDKTNITDYISDHYPVIVSWTDE